MIKRNLVERPAYEIKEFVKALGVTPILNQDSIITSLMDAPRSLVIAYPGWGKTSISAIVSLLSAWLNPGRRVGCFAPVWRQSQQLYAVIKKIIDNSPLLQTAIDDCYMDSSRWKIKFNAADGLNPSCIDSFAISSSSILKGYRCHTAILDNASNIPEDTFNMGLRPMLVPGMDPITSVRYQNEIDMLNSLEFLSLEMRVLAADDMEKNFMGSIPKSKMIIFTSPFWKDHYLQRLYETWCSDAKAFVTNITIGSGEWTL